MRGFPATRVVRIAGRRRVFPHVRVGEGFRLELSDQFASLHGVIVRTTRDPLLVG